MLSEEFQKPYITGKAWAPPSHAILSLPYPRSARTGLFTE